MKPVEPLSALEGTGESDLAPNWVKLDPNGTTQGLFQIRFQHMRQNVLKSDVKKSRICSLGTNMTPLEGHGVQGCRIWIQVEKYGTLIKG